MSSIKWIPSETIDVLIPVMPPENVAVPIWVYVPKFLKLVPTERSSVAEALVFLSLMFRLIALYSSFYV